MGIRRQIYLDDDTDKLLKEQHRQKGLSVSELIRQAVQQTYGLGRRLTWDEVFARRVRAGSATTDPWIYSTIFDGDVDDWGEDETLDTYP